MKSNKFNTIVDSAWGSSGKGAASTRLADIHGVKNLSSCNFPNAGHTVVSGDRQFVFKCLPSGASLAAMGKHHPNLWVGPGSGFNVNQLYDEFIQTGYLNSDCTPNMEMSDAVVRIHERAVVVDQRHIDAESPDGSQSTLHISSTMSGSGAAIAEKTMRLPTTRLYGNVQYNIGSCNNWDFYNYVREHMECGETFLHEVSQGFALSIESGTHYPHCTSRECTPQQAYAYFGITPNLVGDVYLNVRSFPIRVGNNKDSNGDLVGYSGDCMQDQRELTWEEIANRAEFPPDEIAALAERERTTVTKKIRRVFTPSWNLLEFSAKFCGATKLILNFPQYIHWSAHKVRGGHEAFRTLHRNVRDYVTKMEDVTGLPVVMIGTGADHDDYIFIG